MGCWWGCLSIELPCTLIKAFWRNFGWNDNNFRGYLASCVSKKAIAETNSIVCGLLFCRLRTHKPYQKLSSWLWTSNSIDYDILLEFSKHFQNSHISRLYQKLSSWPACKILMGSAWQVCSHRCVVRAATLENMKFWYKYNVTSIIYKIYSQVWLVRPRLKI